MATATKSYRVTKTDEGCFGVEVDGELVDDGFDTAEEAKEEARRLRRYDLIADLRDEVSAWVDGMLDSDDAEAVAKLKKALKVLSA